MKHITQQEADYLVDTRMVAFQQGERFENSRGEYPEDIEGRWEWCYDITNAILRVEWLRANGFTAELFTDMDCYPTDWVILTDYPMGI